MKNTFKRISFLACSLALFLTACGAPKSGHVCAFDQVVTTEDFLKSEATCQSKPTYYFSCVCGKHGEETFQHGYKLSHDYTAEIPEAKYLKKAATCQKPAEYYKSCATCGAKANYYQTFTYGELGECNFSLEIPEGKFLKDEATKTASAVYYKSCVCGKHTEDETFSYGDPLKTYTEEEKIPYTPVSMTVTLYDAENSIYGFTCNTQKEPLRPVLQIQKLSAFDESADFVEYNVTVEKASSYNENDSSFTYYIVKAEATLDIGAEYSYRIYDKYVETGSTPATIKARDVKSDKFTFTHVSDSQDYPTEFGYVLNSVSNTTDFLLHTGDVVESSKHEHHWKAMLNGNFANLSKTPMMAISGNHETTYKHGSNETFKHFHYKLPTQNSTLNGFFYSFTYGNAKFIMLNTNVLTSNRLTSEQYDWLVNELKSNDETWTIVAMHNPVYSAGRYGSEATRNEIALALQPQLQGIFAQYGVDIVLQGHDHVVSSTHPLNGQGQAQTETKQTVDGIEYSVNPQGVYYMMTGTSGGQTRSPYTTDSAMYKYALQSKASSFTQFEIDGNSMKISVCYAQSGEVKTYKTWGIQKTAV